MLEWSAPHIAVVGGLGTFSLVRDVEADAPDAALPQDKVYE